MKMKELYEKYPKLTINTFILYVGLSLSGYILRDNIPDFLGFVHVSLLGLILTATIHLDYLISDLKESLQ